MEYFHEFQQGPSLINDSSRSKKFLTRQWSQSTFSMISTKKAKVSEYNNKNKERKDLYWKLSKKLEEELKQIKNHNTPQAREKLRLLQKCRNQKHIRNKNDSEYRQTYRREYGTVSQKTSLHNSRPKTGCLKSEENSMMKMRKKSQMNKYGINLANVAFNQRQKQNMNRNMLHKKFEKIKEDCAKQYSISQQIRQNIQTVHFYQRLISKNSSIIFAKIL